MGRLQLIWPDSAEIRANKSMLNTHKRRQSPQASPRHVTMWAHTYLGPGRKACVVGREFVMLLLVRVLQNASVCARTRAGSVHLGCITAAAKVVAASSDDERTDRPQSFRWKHAPPGMCCAASAAVAAEGRLHQYRSARQNRPDPVK